MKTTLTTTILLLFTQFCFAQDFWMQLNLPGDTTLNALAGNSEGTVFAATRKGVYISYDNGLNWTNTEITNSAYRLIVDKEDRIFAAIYPNLHYSTNNGYSWSEITFPSGGIVALYVNNNTIVFGNWGSIYKSADFGDTWTQTLEISNAKEVASIIETADGTMFAGITAWSVPGGGVYRSIDNADSWEQSGLPNKYIRSLAVNSQGVIFAGSIGDHSQYYGGLYKSSDNGETWVELRNDVLVTSIVITPDDNIYFGSNEYGDKAGVFFSNDNGETWERIVSGLIGPSNQKIEGLSLAPDGYLYAYGNHLHRSVEPVFTPNSIYDSEKSEFMIFPNPFTDFLHIELPFDQNLHEFIKIEVFDSAGRLVYSHNIDNQYSKTINLSFLRPGLYYVSLEESRQRFTKTILKTQ